MRSLALLLFAAAGCAKQAEPPPPPKPLPLPAEALPKTPPPPPFDFVAYGDCRSDHDVHGRICASILRSRPKFVMVSGDLVDFGESAEDWKTFRAVTKELRSRTEYWPAPGNHDVSFDRAFEKEFGLEKPYYDRRSGDIHVFLLDSNAYFAEAEQLRWLEEKAAASDARHKFAVFHHPPFSIDSFGDYEKKPVRERLHPILVKHKFCAAFAGHHHAFYATLRDGVRHVVTAGGGAPLYQIDPSQAIPGDVYRSFHHYVGCRVLEKKITAQVYDPNGVESPELAFTLCEHP